MVVKSVGQSVIYSVGHFISPYVCRSFMLSCISLGQAVAWSGRLHGRSVNCSVSCLVSGLDGVWFGCWFAWLVIFSDGSLVGGFQLRRNVEGMALADLPLQRNLVTIL